MVTVFIDNLHSDSWEDRAFNKRMRLCTVLAHIHVLRLIAMQHVPILFDKLERSGSPIQRELSLEIAREHPSKRAAFFIEI